MSIQEWLPKSNTEAEIAVGKHYALLRMFHVLELCKKKLIRIFAVFSLPLFFANCVYLRVRLTGLAVEAMKAHPQHARLHVECFKCLRDLDHDTKVAISHAGFYHKLNSCHSFESIQRKKRDRRGRERRRAERERSRARAKERERDV